jgi:hypothetical protein
VVRSRSASFAASIAIYAAVTAVLGRDVLSHLSTGIAHDAGDPLLTALLLHWNAWVLPYSEAWWQLPAFFPTADTMAFSEHMLGLSVIASPIEWVSRDPLVSANLVTLLTFVLSGAAAYLLVQRLTGSSAGAFVAGLAFGFSPYRVGQLPHLQMLASFWAPVALLGLHLYLDTGRRRWLVLYGAAWLLQAASNGYFLIFFSLFVALWVLWFVIAPRRWRDLGAIAVATILAGLPLVPILLRYIDIHARHGFTRSLFEVNLFSADLGAVLCAPADLIAWNWIRVACRPEGELFPGAMLSVLLLLGFLMLLYGAIFPARTAPADAGPHGLRPVAPALASSRWLRRLRAIALVVAVLNFAAILAFFLVGSWRIEFAGLRVSTSSLAKPLFVLLISLPTFVMLSPRVMAGMRRHNTVAFYGFGAVATWVLALGPYLVVMGELTNMRLPFAWLMSVPGLMSIRVPARFWMVTTLCLAVLAGFAAARMLAALTRRGASPALVGGVLAVMAAGILADGWTDPIMSVPVVRMMPNPDLARGRVVLHLPAGDVRDVGPEFEAVTGGWTTVNGYSGYEPRSHAAVAYAVRAELDELFPPFQALTELDVVVPSDAGRLIALVERQAGVTVVARSTAATHYRLPKRPAVPRAELGERRPIARLETTCLPALLPMAIDGDAESRWYCGPQNGAEELTADLGTVTTVGGVRLVLGTYNPDFPRELEIATSEDGTAWMPARSGATVESVITGALDEPRLPAAAFTFEPRPARFVRLRQTGKDDRGYWSVPELDIWSGAAR